MGRPPKYSSNQDRKIAHRQSQQKYYLHQRQQSLSTIATSTIPSESTQFSHLFSHPPHIPPTTDNITGLHIHPSLYIPSPPLPRQTDSHVSIEQQRCHDYSNVCTEDGGLSSSPPVWRSFDSLVLPSGDYFTQSNEELHREQNQLENQRLLSQIPPTTATPENLASLDEELAQLSDSISTQLNILSPNAGFSPNSDEVKQQPASGLHTSQSPNAAPPVHSPQQLRFWNWLMAGQNNHYQDTHGFWNTRSQSMEQFLLRYPAIRSAADGPPSQQDVIFHIRLYNLSHRLRLQHYLETEDIIAALQLLVSYSGLTEFGIPVRPLIVDDSTDVPYPPSELELFLSPNILLIPTFFPAQHIRDPGHWAITCYYRPSGLVIYFDSLGYNSQRASQVQAKLALLANIIETAPPKLQFIIPLITQQQSTWTCGIIAIECARLLITILQHTDNPAIPLAGMLDWVMLGPLTQKSTHHGLSTREAQSISFWVQLLEGHLSNQCLPKNTVLPEVLHNIPQVPKGINRDQSPPRSAKGQNNNNHPLALHELLATEWASLPGCSSRDHDEKHNKAIAEAAVRKSVSNTCSSIGEVWNCLEGRTARDHAGLPCVLSPGEDLLHPGVRSRFIQQHRPGTAGHTLLANITQRAFEGAAEGEGPPPRVCLHCRHGVTSDAATTEVEQTFDIDSMCAFPLSLGVARQGLQWNATWKPTLNLTNNVHLSLEVPAIGGDTEGSPVRSQPLHHIPNYCFGRVIGVVDTFIWVFFPALYKGSLTDPYERTCLPAGQYKHWFDYVVLPAIRESVPSINALQHLPGSYKSAAANARAPNEARIRKSDGSIPQTQMLSYTLTGQVLHPIWMKIQERAQGYREYRGVRLFMGYKNTKLRFMSDSLGETLQAWSADWDYAVDRQYLDEDVTFVDVGRQLTPRPSSGLENNVLLWRKCCLDGIWQSRKAWSEANNAAGSSAGKPHLTKTEYPFVTLRDAVNMTITMSQDSAEFRNGLVYSQFYDLIKTPFDAAKTFPFQSRGTESMALDPSYLRDKENSTRGLHAHMATLIKSYRLSKARVNANVPASVANGECGDQGFTFGVRAEDRVSFGLLRRITAVANGQLSPPARAEPPFFAIPSSSAAGFLRASVNRYCFLFEHVRAATSMKFSLAETAVMVVALRGLRFSYTSSLIAMEPVLWKDRWTPRRAGRDPIEREGLGLGRASEDHGFGWWLPGKFDWPACRFREDVGDRIMAGNSLLRLDYKRQWRAMQDVRDIHFRLWQAQSWLTKYSVAGKAAATDTWLEYLHATVIEAFDRDVWLEARKSLKWRTGPGLNDNAARAHPESSPPVYCYDAMSTLFYNHEIEQEHSRPHMVSGNRMRTQSVRALFEDLFSPRSRPESVGLRQGWESRPYRIAVRRSLEIIAAAFGDAAAERWYRDLFKLVVATHWVLPWPSERALLSTTKENPRQKLKRQLMWASVVYRPDYSRMGSAKLTGQAPELWMDEPDEEISKSFEMQKALDFDTSHVKVSSTYASQHILSRIKARIRLDRLEFGRAVQPGSWGMIYPVVEIGRPPQLGFVKSIRNRTSAELDALFFSIINSSSCNGGVDSPTETPFSSANSTPVAQPRGPEKRAIYSQTDLSSSASSPQSADNHSDSSYRQPKRARKKAIGSSLISSKRAVFRQTRLQLARRD